MVSRIEYYAGKSERQRFLVIPAIMTFALWFQVEIAALVIGVFFLCYAGVGVILTAQRWLEARVAFDSQAR